MKRAWANASAVRGLVASAKVAVDLTAGDRVGKEVSKFPIGDCQLTIGKTGRVDFLKSAIGNWQSEMSKTLC